MRPKEAPLNMLVAMGITAAFCIGIGVLPGLLYAILPYDVTYHAYTLEHIVTQIQLLIFAALAFTVLMRTGLYPPELKSTNLDTDWFWRRPLARLAGGTWRGLLAGWAALGRRGLLASGRIARELYHHHGPTGALARTRPSGSMALWMAVLLLLFLVSSFF
jgi:multicomponent Na+:H+ antiporter subunit D